MGRCEAVGYCSYPDLGCADTGHRFDDSAGDGLGGQCVGTETAGTGSSGDTGLWPSSGNPDDSGTTSSPPIGTDDSTTGGDSETTDGSCGAAGDPCCAGDQCDPGLTCQEDRCGCITAVEVGDRHSCALKNNGTVECWGDNAAGQLGIPDVESSTTPLAVPGITNATAMAARLHTCVRLADSTVHCWGENASGRADPGSLDPILTSPSDVTLSIGSDLIAAGGAHSCAAGELGEPVQCWGANGSGQITGAESPGPASATMPADFSPGMLRLGNNHSCVASVTGELLCWGNNSSGQLAIDPLVTSSTSTPTIIGVDPVGDLVTGADHTCARIGSEVHCWGLNTSGQLGNNTTTTGSMPVVVAFEPGTAMVRQLAAAGDHTCAVLHNDEVQCWGGNARGEIALVVDKNGDDSGSLTPRATKVDFPVAQLATGPEHSCALSTDGQLYCWGNNDFGQLGDGTTTDTSTPTAVQLDCP